MPEGDTLFRVARTLGRALLGQVVRRFESAYAKLLHVDEEAPLVGRTVERVEARGKWCLIRFGPRPGGGDRPRDGALILCTHLRMNGMWHLYRTGERWQRSASDLRVLLATDAFVAVGFRVPVAELLTEEELARHPDLSRLGPDLLSESFDEEEAMRRLRARGDQELAQALLDQSAVAGLGNVYKSELCFLVGMNPLMKVGAVPDEVLRRILHLSRRLLRENVLAPEQVVTRAGMRRTTGAMDPRSRLWVYGRGGQPCRRCGAEIRELRQGLDARVTFFCPRCQPLSESESGKAAGQIKIG
jgi:endonuclease-8